MKRVLILCISLLASAASFGQDFLKYENMITAEQLLSKVEYLSDTITQGRANNTGGHIISEQYILSKFKQYNLKPLNYKHIYSFRQRSNMIRNIFGIMPAIEDTDRYIVISAHYDHIGTLNGKVYSGADDNASGVAVMLTLAETLAKMREEGIGPKVNILFAAFDGKELSMAGSEYFTRNLPIEKKNIICDMNFDIIGSTLVPTGKNKEYLIMLGESSLPAKYQGLMRECNALSRFSMDIDYTFYGSKDFTRMMYELGDHNSFVKENIPALFFTSGFHDHTYKPTDTMKIIDGDVLTKRTRLIFNYLLKFVL